MYGCLTEGCPWTLGRCENRACVAYLGYGHGASDGTDAVADGGQEANLHAVDRLVEVLDLLLLGRFVIPLIGDRGVGLGVDVGLFEWVGHGEGGCCGEGSLCEGSVSGGWSDGCEGCFEEE